MENFVLNTIVSFASEKGFETLIGEYLPTAKNAMVKDHYQNLDFENKNAKWYLALAGYKNRKTFISTKLTVNAES